MFLITPTYQRCRALLALGRGDAAEARRWAEPALEEAAARGYAWPMLEATRALGQAALLAHEPERAVTYLRAVWEHTEREGVDEPGAFPVAGELVEALTRARRARRGARRHRTPEDARPAATIRGRTPRSPAARAEHDEAAARLRGARPALRRRPRAARARPRPAPRNGSGAPPARRSRAPRPPSTRSARPAGSGRPRRSSRASAGASRGAGELTETERQVAGLAAAGRTQQGDRAGPVRDRPHGRGAPLEHVREAGRQDPYTARRAPLKIPDPGNFAAGPAPVASSRALPISPVARPCPKGLDAAPLHPSRGSALSSPTSRCATCSATSRSATSTRPWPRRPAPSPSTCETITAERPLALLVENAQWTDRASLKVLAHLARCNLPLLLVLAPRRRRRQHP